MKERELETIVRILSILHSVSMVSLLAVPAMFRPSGIQAKLDEVAELIEQLRTPRR